MTEYELHQMIAQSIDTLHSLNEFWLTISFAVVVAVTYAPKVLTRVYTAILFYGYLAAATSFILARFNVAYVVTKYVQQLQGAGYDTPPHANPIALVSTVGIYLIMVVGTIAILYYIKKTTKNSGHSNT